MEYFTINELCKSYTAIRNGINNTPTIEAESNLKDLIKNILDPLREAWGAPIIVTSGYRCEKLNKIVGGATNSQHVTGQAADIRTLSDTKEDNKKLYELIRKLNLPIDQCINEYEYDWIHVSYSNRHRRQFFEIKN